jgi:hypothetical protein
MGRSLRQNWERSTVDDSQVTDKKTKKEFTQRPLRTQKAQRRGKSKERTPHETIGVSAGAVTRKEKSTGLPGKKAR